MWYLWGSTGMRVLETVELNPLLRLIPLPECLYPVMTVSLTKPKESIFCTISLCPEIKVEPNSYGGRGLRKEGLSHSQSSC